MDEREVWHGPIHEVSVCGNLFKLTWTKRVNQYGHGEFFNTSMKRVDVLQLLISSGIFVCITIHENLWLNGLYQEIIKEVNANDMSWKVRIYGGDVDETINIQSLGIESLGRWLISHFTYSHDLIFKRKCHFMLIFCYSRLILHF